MTTATTTWSLSGPAVLLCDHRNQGASDGAPRRGINPWIQCRGYRDAIRLIACLQIEPCAVRSAASRAIQPRLSRLRV